MYGSGSFEKCLNFVLRQEGGYSNDPHDKGGETNYGLSKRFLNAHGIDKKVSELTMQDVRTIYYTYIWLPSQAEKFNDATVQLFVFDCSVNHGISAAAGLLQQAVNYLTPIAVDSIIGKQTIKATNDLINSTSFPLLLELMKLVRGGYYLHIVDRDSTQKRFLKGWLKRNSDVFGAL